LKENFLVICAQIPDFSLGEIGHHKYYLFLLKKQIHHNMEFLREFLKHYDIQNDSYVQNKNLFLFGYLGTSLSEILDDIDMSQDEFNKICDQFSNKALFKCDSHGNLIKDKRGDLIKINYNNE